MTESPESTTDQGKRMDKDSNLWDFFHVAPSGIHYSDMSEQEKLDYDKRKEESISRYPPPEAFFNFSTDRFYYYENNTATTSTTDDEYFSPLPH